MYLIGGSIKPARKSYVRKCHFVENNEGAVVDETELRRQRREVVRRETAPFMKRTVKQTSSRPLRGDKATRPDYKTMNNIDYATNCQYK